MTDMDRALREDARGTQPPKPTKRSPPPPAPAGACDGGRDRGKPQGDPPGMEETLRVAVDAIRHGAREVTIEAGTDDQ